MHAGFPGSTGRDLGVEVGHGFVWHPDVCSKDLPENTLLPCIIEPNLQGWENDTLLIHFGCPGIGTRCPASDIEMVDICPRQTHERPVYKYRRE